MGIVVEEILVILGMVLHVFICPYSKVEESFNTQAIHDLLYYQTNISRFDHLEFPGVVPRTFLGPVLVALTSIPYVTFLDLLQVQKIWAQIVVRCILGCIVLIGLFSFVSAVRDRLGNTTAKLTLLVTLTQFHFMFYMSRTLPNVFALVLVLLALTSWIRQNHVSFLWFSGAAIILFRSELCLYLGILLLMELVSRRLSLVSFITTVVPAGMVMLSLTVCVDSYFWQRLLWPEGEVLWFNTILNKSSKWGTLPFLWYFYSALPRALSCSLPLVPFGLYMSPPLRQLVLPALLFVFLYSFLPHKELRFIIYVIPVFNVAVADTLNRLWINRDKSKLKKLIAVVAMLHLLGNVCTTGVFMYSSSINYPGGEALYRLHQLESRETAVNVHIDVATAQTGVTRFGQMYPGWRYNKTEDLVPGGYDMMSFSHIILGEKENLKFYVKTHTVTDSIEAFDGISINKDKFPFITFRKSPKIWILKKNVQER